MVTGSNSGVTKRHLRQVFGMTLALVTFFALFITHICEAAAWGLFLWRKGLSPTFTEGIYFSATSITSLGYGDLVLPPPWRILGPLVAISGTLMFGCSTAFLFMVLQKCRRCGCRGSRWPSENEI